MMPEEEPLTRKRRSLLGAAAPAAESPPGAPSAAATAPDVRERTTPVTEAIQRRGRPTGDSPDRGRDKHTPTLDPPPPNVPAPASGTPGGASATPPTRDRTSDGWFLATGQSPPERTMSGEEPAIAPPPRNPWLWAAPIAGIGAVGLLFVLALVAAIAFLG